MKNPALEFALAPSFACHAVDARRRPRLRLRVLRPAPAVRSGPWTVCEKSLFLERLADSDAVDVAARAAGRTRSSAFSERARDAIFAREWDSALDPRVVRLETLLLDRTIARLEPVMAVEKLNEAAIRHDSTIGMWFLENLMPLRYGKPRASAPAAPAPDRPAQRPENAAEDNAEVGRLIEAAAKRMEEAEAFVPASLPIRRRKPV